MTIEPRDPDRPADGDDQTWEALARYLAGESDASEAAEVRRLLAERPGDAALLEALDRVLSPERLSPAPVVDMEGALRKVRQRRDGGEEQHRHPRLTVTDGAPRRAVSWRVVAPALAAAAMLTAALFLWNRMGRPDGAEPAAGGRTIATAIGRRDSVQLSDGSRVLLAPGTELSISAGYGEAGREVELHGEAQFRVVHDDQHPFVVHAGDLVIKDVGTTFNVRSVMPDSVVVSVSEGAVLLESPIANGNVELHAGDVAALGPGSGAVVHRGGASDVDVAWTRGKLMLRDAPVSTVVYELHRWYGIELRVDDPVLAGRHYTATFDGTAPVDEVLSVIRTLWDASMERHGDTVVMRRAGGT